MNIVANEGHATLLENCLKSGGISELLQKNCLQFPVSSAILLPTITSLVDGMRRITDQPGLDQLYPWHKYIIDGYGKKYEQEAGLDHNQKDGENKHVFQFIRGAPCALGAMGSIGSGSIIPPRLCLDFDRTLSQLERMARDLALIIGKSIDDHYGEKRPYEGSMYERILYGTIVIRCLRYLSGKGGPMDANMHYDRSLLTFHIYATHEGLWIILPDGTPIRIFECSYEMLCVFFGRKYMAATRDLRNGSAHGVKYERRSNEDRVSIVIFVHPQANSGDVNFLKSNNDTIRAMQDSITL